MGLMSLRRIGYTMIAAGAAALVRALVYGVTG